MTTPNSLYMGLRSLVIFRNLLQDDVIRRLSALLELTPAPSVSFVDAYCDFASALFAHTDNFSDYLLNAVLDDENF